MYTRNIHTISGSQYRFWSLRFSSLKYLEFERFIHNSDFKFVKKREIYLIKVFKILGETVAQIYLLVITNNIYGYYWQCLFNNILINKQK